MDLFDHALQKRMKTEALLAARMRPRTLDDILVQEEILGQGKRRERIAQLHRAIEADQLFSGAVVL